MDANPVSCPVCTLYLRPGITLKTHLASHPKQKVIEALCRLSGSALEDIPKIENSSSALSTTTSQSSEICSAISSQLNTAILNQSWNQGNLVPTIPPGNHVFIYQQSMSSSTTATPHQPNVLNVDPQYVIPTVLNPQMMPYIYQQQQVIMSSGSCLSPMRTLPLELPSTSTQCSITEEVGDEPDEPKVAFDEAGVKEDENGGELEVEPASVEVISENYEENNYENLENTDQSNFKSESSELNKACQTTNSDNSNSDDLLPEEEDEDETDIPSEDLKNGGYFEAQPVPFSSESNPGIYTSTATILQQAGSSTSEQFDFVEMDGMHVVINDLNDFSAGQVISQVENFEGCAPDRPGVLMTIGGMDKDEYAEHESVSRESSNVNIRADERMPPRGELSGQESLSSDITWHRISYPEGPSAMSSSYELLGRDAWEASDSSDVEELPPLQSRLPVAYPEQEEEVFKCGTCSEAFVTLEDKAEHERQKHSSSKPRKLNRIGGKLDSGKKVKKLVVKSKADKVETAATVNSFDNVFTNKLKMELSTEAETVDEEKGNAVPEQVLLKTDESSTAVEVKAVCPICDCVLLNAKALKEHKQTVHNITAQTRHKCMTCDELFPNDYKFSEHLRIHPLECKICGRLFYRRQNIQLHMRRHLGIKPYKCETCEKSFLTKQKLDEHRNIHTGEAPIKCNLCDETFRRHSNLVQHRNRHHLNVKKKLKDYMCSCKEVFHSKKKLAWHKEIHDAKPKSCTECNEKFIHMSSLTRHMRRAHNDKFLPNEQRTSENVVCPICKGVYLKSSLEVHIRNHSGQRPYSCLICNKDFTTKWNLKLHKWTHASRVSKPFKCDQCKGAFIREADYVAHMNSHKSIRPYTCNYCGAQFIRKYNCQRHVKEHENEKMFNCKVCGKTFHRSYYLKDHMRIHSGARPFSCHICGKTSTTKSNHNKHVQIHHAREPVSTEN